MLSQKKTDPSKGYWQVGLSVTSHILTAFDTPKGLFKFKTMPFGLANFRERCFAENSWPTYRTLTVSLIICGFSLKFDRTILGHCVRYWTDSGPLN